MILLLYPTKMSYDKERTYERCLMKWSSIKLCSMLNANQHHVRGSFLLNILTKCVNCISIYHKYGN